MGNGPLGSGTAAIIDSGTLSSRCQKPPCVQGNEFAHARKAHRFNALAMFDLENAVIWVNEPLLQELKRIHGSKEHLAHRHLETLVHEFVHVLQYRDIFDKHTDRKTRSTAMIKHRADKIANSTEDEFVTYILKKEGNAEFQAQLVVNELLNAFSLRQKHRGFSKQERHLIATEKAKGWLKLNKESYREGAIKSYRKLKAVTKKEGGADAVVEASEAKKRESAKLLPVARFQSAFPTEDSPRLKKLVKMMINYNMVIVVGFD